MRVIYVDDERSAHINFRYVIRDRADISEVKYLSDYESTIEYAQNHEIDCAFLDVSLPGKDGIELAKELSLLQPHIEFAFVTGYDDYAREAYQVGGRAYISKPYSKDEINKVLSLMEKLVHPPKEIKDRQYNQSINIFAKTFGTFDLIVDAKPVHFRNAKAKELLAFLIHQMGGSASNSQIFFALWERQEYTSSTSTYVRRTVRALREELEKSGLEHILTSERNSTSVDMRKINCDAYELLFGNGYAVCKYNGEYMKQYYWGEEMIPLLDRIVEDIRDNQDNK